VVDALIGLLERDELPVLSLRDAEPAGDAQ
jgi:hypothetical protein